MTASSDTGGAGGSTRRFLRLVSVIVPARNAAEVLPGQLEALAGQTYLGPWEVIVVDNGSVDATAEVARDWAAKIPDLRVVPATARVGVNHARNTGAAVARGDLLVFCDADDVATAGWLHAMVAAARTADLVGGYVDTNLLNDARVRSWRPAQPYDRLPVNMSFLPYGVGASLGVWSAVHRALGGFNERYARGGDDVEFCWRAQLASYTIAFAPQAVMGYRLRGRLWPLVRQGYGYGRADARLYRDFRQHGIVPRDVRAAAECWVRLARKLPQLASREHAGDWLYTAGWRFGRLVGSIQFRVMCP